MTDGGGIARVRLLPLEAEAVRYSGDLASAQAVERLTGEPAGRAEDGTATVRCPATGRAVTLLPGMVVVRFTGEPCRVVVTSGPALGAMYEALGDGGDGDPEGTAP